jgi:hypothetical protein
VINGGGATDFCARFLDLNEKPLKGFTVSVGEVAKVKLLLCSKRMLP